LELYTKDECIDATYMSQGTVKMTRQVYDLCGANDVRFSPYCWRTRMALAHKRLDAEFLAWHFTEQERLKFSGSRTVPVLVDGDEVISDSWRIAIIWKQLIPRGHHCLGVKVVLN